MTIKWSCYRILILYILCNESTGSVNPVHTQPPKGLPYPSTDEVRTGLNSIHVTPHLIQQLFSHIAVELSLGE